jgi:FtsP/CotA-like multicopper oxidase with cupredoxin domain
MRRRHFLILAGGALGSVALSRCAARVTPAPERSRLTSQGGRLTADITATEQTVTLAGRSAQLLAYNQQVPGPLWEAQAGDTVQVNFTNRLAAPTNLHFHGLHISPTGNADNAFLKVPPGERQLYEFTLPAKHPGGLFWYHPHYHGLVAEQVFGGLAGAFVIRGEVDQIPEIQAAEEAILVLQDFDLDRQGNRREPMPMFRRWGREGNLITVNGDRAPTLKIPQSGLLRLRLLNASPSRIYRLRLANHPWHLIGLDGGTLTAPVELEDDLILAPGERADLLVAGDREPDSYALMSLPYDRGIADMMGGLQGDERDRVEMGEVKVAQLNYGEAIAEVPLPQALISATAIPEPIRKREFVLDHGIDVGQYFLINGRGFDHHRIDTTVELGTVEDWRIINQAGMDHPFHIHTNAFQVISRNGTPDPLQVWKDVVNVKPYEFVDIRMAFTDFPGKTVYHCHILDHEDQGMMGILEIQQPAAQPTTSKPSLG